MRIGYFAHTHVSVSETFVHDLLLALNHRSDHFVFVSGASSGQALPGIQSIFSGYYSAGQKGAYLLYKIGQLLGGKGDQLKYSHLQRTAYQVLKQYSSDLSALDVAFVDYGTSSSVLYPVFKAFNIPYIVRVLGYDVSSAFASASYKREFLISCKHASAVIAVSHHLKRLLVLAGVDPQKISVIRIGGNPSYMLPQSWRERLKLAPSVVHLGRLTPKKHPLALIHAFSVAKQYVHNAKLTIIGDGPLMNACKNRVVQLRLDDAVHFTGALSREHAIPIMNKHWVFAQHSVTSMNGDQEGFPVSPVEAAICELPVVTTAHSGLTEQVVHGETGFIVQEHNYEDMGERIAWLMQHPQEAERMGKAGRKRMQSLCNPEKQMEQVYQLLQTTHESQAMVMS